MCTELFCQIRSNIFMCFSSPDSPHSNRLENLQTLKNVRNQKKNPFASQNIEDSSPVLADRSQNMVDSSQKLKDFFQNMAKYSKHRPCSKKNISLKWLYQFWDESAIFWAWSSKIEMNLPNFVMHLLIVAAPIPLTAEKQTFSMPYFDFLLAPEKVHEKIGCWRWIICDFCTIRLPIMMTIHSF